MYPFFNKFKTTNYKIDDVNKMTTDIITGFVLDKYITTKSISYAELEIDEGSLPESISYDNYNDTVHYWTILLANKIVNPYLEWIMSISVLTNFVEKKYQYGIRQKNKNGTWTVLPASIGMNGIHHFKNLLTNTICDDVDDKNYRNVYVTNPTGFDTLHPNIFKITNLEYERNVNLKYKNIGIISSQNLMQFEQDFSDKLSMSGMIY